MISSAAALPLTISLVHRSGDPRGHRRPRAGDADLLVVGVRHLTSELDKQAVAHRRCPLLRCRDDRARRLDLVPLLGYQTLASPPRLAHVLPLRLRLPRSRLQRRLPRMRLTPRPRELDRENATAAGRQTVGPM